jgi:hypothetical protein
MTGPIDGDRSRRGRQGRDPTRVHDGCGGARLTAGALGATTAGLSAVALPSVASASTLFVCHKFLGYLTSTVTVAKCGVAQKGAHFAGGDLLMGGTLTWAVSKATTTYTGTSTSPGQGVCQTGRVEYDFTGTVTADTSGYATVGDAVAYDVCVNSTTHVVKLVLHATGTF